MLTLQDIPEPAIQAGTVKVRTRAIGLNYADIYRRRGNYHLVGEPPYILGYEGAGVVEEVAPDVEGIQVGDRVGFADAPHGNAELVLVPADRVIKLPEGISYEDAAAVLLQGLTAQYLVNDSYAVKQGDRVLVHAAAGGVGQLLIQLCKARGAQVIGLTSSPEKREAALAAGADEVFLYNTDWVSDVLKWSAVSAEVAATGLDVAYDSVGSTLMDSFKVVRIKGTVVFFGMAGGDPAPVDPRMLMDTSKTLTGGDLWNHITSAEERSRRGSELFADMLEGRLRLSEPTTFRLADGAEAHRYLESRASTGKILLIP